MKRDALGHWLRHLGSDDSEREAELLSTEVAHSGAVRADQCQVGQCVDVIGKLRMVQWQPRNAVAEFTAELYDGTDTIELIWLGRRTIAGIEAGRRVRASGRLALRDGCKAIYNPTYELLPSN